MAYVKGGDIMAADYNSFMNAIVNLYGVGGTQNGEPDGSFGYGQSSIVLYPVQPDDTIRSTEWLNLRNLIEQIAVHQGTAVSLPPQAAFATDADILAHPPAPGDIPGAIAAIRTNRLKAASTSLSVVQNVLTMQYTQAWRNRIGFTFDAAFANANQARHFFNTGGEIQVTVTRTGGIESAQNTGWSDMLTEIGTVKMRAASTQAFNHSSGTWSGKGYYNLLSYTDGGTTIVESQTKNTNTFHGNYYVRVGRLNETNVGGANGTGVRFMLDLFNTANPDNLFVDGTITVKVDYAIATNPFRVTGPSITMISQGTTVTGTTPS